MTIQKKINKMIIQYILYNALLFKTSVMKINK